MMDPNGRYARQIRLPQIGVQGQERLAQTRVLVVGVGGLGGFLSEFLVRAGVGFVRIVDRDVPATINLHRQIQFDEEDVKRAVPKAEAAALRLASINSDVTVEGVVADVSAPTVLKLVSDVDLVLDGADNFETRFLLNDACVRRGVPWVYGGVLGSMGMAMLVRPKIGPCLRCLLPDLPPPGSTPTCEAAGVLATAVAMVASLQATEAIQWIVDPRRAESWAPHAVLYSLGLFPPSLRTIRVNRDPNCPCCGLGQFDFLGRTTESEILGL